MVHGVYVRIPFTVNDQQPQKREEIIMAYGCLKLNKETPDPQKDCDPCKDFAKKYFDRDRFIQGIDGGAQANCVHAKVKFKKKV